MKEKEKIKCKTFVNKYGTYITICDYKYGHTHHK